MPFRPHKVDPRLLAFARSMRQEPAPAEKKLWRCLRNRQLNGFKFRRQIGFGAYIADFYCAECRLIVELDGDSHSEREPYDAERTRALEAQHDLIVVRFVNTDIFDHLDSVLDAILRECEARAPGAPVGPSPQPSPLSTGERG